MILRRTLTKQSKAKLLICNNVYEDVTQKSKYLENGTLIVVPIKKHSLRINSYNMSKNILLYFSSGGDFSNLHFFAFAKIAQSLLTTDINYNSVYRL